MTPKEALQVLIAVADEFSCQGKVHKKVQEAVVVLYRHLDKEEQLKPSAEEN